MQNNEEFLDAAERMAADAVSIIERYFLRQLTIEHKTGNDPVTDADREVELFVQERIADLFPDHAILGEEFGLFGPEDAEYVWAIDPLDGTLNFVCGVPHFAFSIGLLHKGAPVVGLIREIPSGRIFKARRGFGAEGPNGTIRVCERTSLEQCYQITFGTNALRYGLKPGSSWRLDKFILQNDCVSIRNYGVASIHLAWVAAGWTDAYVDYGACLWDIAAGSLIVEEAGGVVSDPFSAAPVFPLDVKNADLHDMRFTLIAANRDLQTVIPGRLES